MQRSADPPIRSMRHIGEPENYSKNWENLSKWSIFLNNKKVKSNAVH